MLSWLKTNKPKVLSEDSRKRKRESDQIKGRTRINIGPAFARWRELKEEEGCSTDAGRQKLNKSVTLCLNGVYKFGRGYILASKYCNT